MKRIAVQENSMRVLAVAAAFWGGGAALAAWEGVFAKLSPITFALLVAFALTYAAGSYGLDRGMRTLAAQTRPSILWTLALVADAILAASAISVLGGSAPVLESLARFPHAVSALFVAPFAAVLHLAAFARAARRVSSAPGRSPGANPAAT